MWHCSGCFPVPPLGGLGGWGGVREGALEGDRSGPECFRRPTQLA